MKLKPLEVQQLHPQGFGRSYSTQRATGWFVYKEVSLWSWILIGLNLLLSLWPFHRHSHHQPFIMACLLCVSLNALYRTHRGYFSSFLDTDNVLLRPHLVFRVSGAYWSWLTSREKETRSQTEIVIDLASNLSPSLPYMPLSLLLPSSLQLKLYTSHWNHSGNN